MERERGNHLRLKCILVLLTMVWIAQWACVESVAASIADSISSPQLRTIVARSDELTGSVLLSADNTVDRHYIPGMSAGDAETENQQSADVQTSNTTKNNALQLNYSLEVFDIQNTDADGNAVVNSPDMNIQDNEGNPVVGYTLISEVWITEPRVTAIALEFEKPLYCSWNLTQSFVVHAELKTLLSQEGNAVPGSEWPRTKREIVSAYTSDRPEPGKICEGRYVILELNPLDSNARSVYLDLKRKAQKGGKKNEWNNGIELLRYGKKMVYDIEQLYSLLYADGTKTGVISEFKRTDDRILLADDFVTDTFVSTDKTVRMRVNKENKKVNSIGFALYSPPEVKPGEKYPFILYLHGSSCRSTQDDEQDTRMVPVYTGQGAVTWITNGTQDCYILVPQYEYCLEAIMKECILSFIADGGASRGLQIDMDRVYITGFSMGGITSWELLMDDETGPYFAAALINCGYPLNDYLSEKQEECDSKRRSALKRIADRGTHIWMIHSETDTMVDVNGSYYAYMGLTGIPYKKGMPAPDETEQYKKIWHALDGQINLTILEVKKGQVNTWLNMYSGSTHEVNEYTYAEPFYIDWILSQRKSHEP